jgi:hypothetical protein
MKKSLLTLALVAMGFGFANADEVEFAGNNTAIAYEGEVSGNNVQPLTSLSYEDFTVTFDDSSASTKSAWYYIFSDNNDNANWRLYAKASMTITAPSGCTMTGISFQFPSGWGSANYSNLTASTGAFSPVYDADNVPANGDVITWSGSANELTITVPASKDSWMSKNPQFQFTKMVITYTSTGTPTAPSAPKISGTSTFYTPTTAVTISAASGCDIYYTLAYNGTPADPTIDSAEYDEEIIINDSCTIKAIAVRDGLTSEVAEATFTKASAEEVASIAEFLAKDDNAVCKFTNPVTVVYLSGKYLFVKDETGGLQIFRADAAFDNAYEQGQTISGFTAVRSTYNKNPQAAAKDYIDTFPAEGTGEATTVKPTTLGFDEAIAEQYYNCYVKLENQTITKDGNYYYLVNGDNKIQLYNRFGLDALSDDLLEGSYDVTGFMVIYNTTNEIFYTEIAESSSVKSIETAEGAIYGGNGTIVAPEGAKVYGVNGVSYNTTGLNAGLYIVVANGKAYKVVVK